MNTVKVVIQSSLIVILTLYFSCSPILTKGPPSVPDLIIRNLSYSDLLGIVESAIKKEKFDILKRNNSRGYLATNWIEYQSTQKTGFFHWTERKKIEIFIEPDRLTDQTYFLIIQLNIEEHAPGVSRWHKKEFEKEEDELFIKIITLLNEAVINTGGNLG